MFINIPCFFAIGIAGLGYLTALCYRQWAAAFLATVVITAFTLLGKVTPPGGLYLAALVPVALWYWVDYRPTRHWRTKATAPPVEETIFLTNGPCPCSACQMGKPKR